MVGWRPFFGGCCFAACSVAAAAAGRWWWTPRRRRALACRRPPSSSLSPCTMTNRQEIKHGIIRPSLSLLRRRRRRRSHLHHHCGVCVSRSCHPANLSPPSPARLTARLLSPPGAECPPRTGARSPAPPGCAPRLPTRQPPLPSRGRKLPPRPESRPATAQERVGPAFLASSVSTSEMSRKDGSVMSRQCVPLLSTAVPPTPRPR